MNIEAAQQMDLILKAERAIHKTLSIFKQINISIDKAENKKLYTKKINAMQDVVNAIQSGKNVYLEGVLFN